jgi:hypothetical protein
MQRPSRCFYGGLAIVSSSLKKDGYIEMWCKGGRRMRLWEDIERRRHRENTLDAEERQQMQTIKKLTFFG